MAVWSEVGIDKLEGAMRLDAEYYQPLYLKFAEAVAHGDRMGDILGEVIHPVEVKRVYEEQGIQILLAQNIRCNELDFSACVFMPVSLSTTIARNELKCGDVVVTRSGANYGDSAPYIGKPEKIYACADCLVLRPKREIDGRYLSTYLNSKIGRALIKRGQYGAGQPHVAPTHIKELRVPRLGSLEEEVCQLITKAHEGRIASVDYYSMAESVLLSELGMQHIDLTDTLVYEGSYDETLRNGRLDAEFFMPRYQRLLSKLRNTQPIRIAPLGQFLAFLTNGHTPLHHDLSEGDVPFLTAEHVFDFRVDYQSEKRILRVHHDSELRQTRLGEGDCLITIKGRIGNAAIVEGLVGPVNINQDVALFRLKNGLPPYFLMAYLNSEVGKAFTRQYCTGQINPFLGLGNIRLLPVPIYDSDKMQRIAASTYETVLKARTARNESLRMLDEAKRIVEHAVLGDKS